MGEKNYIDETYFKDVDSEEKAYWLGFIAADGCIHVSSGRPTFSITLSDVDVGHLEKFKAAIKFGGNIGRYKHTSKDKEYGTACISSASKMFCGYVIDQGITPRKSGVLEPWIGENELMRHYWRGVFDGDGGVYLNNRGRWTIMCCGSQAMASGFREFVGGQGCTGGGLYRAASSDKLWYAKYYGARLAQPVARVLYEDATVFLDRKKAKIDDLFLARSDRRVVCPVTGSIELEAVKRLYSQYENIGTVATVLGINASTLYNFCYRNGVSTHSMHENRSSYAG